jgi:hypothetical protein
VRVCQYLFQYPVDCYVTALVLEEFGKTFAAAVLEGHHVRSPDTDSALPRRIKATLATTRAEAPSTIVPTTAWVQTPYGG